MDKKIIDYINGNKERFVSDLGRLVAINSVRGEAKDGKPFGDGPAEALAEAEKILNEHGFEDVNFDNYAGEVTLGEDPVLMLLAHLDVVSEGDGWTREPYRMTEEDGRLYGRGTTDDKGAALACLYAMEAVRECYGIPKKGVRLVLGCGEETGSEDMAFYFSKRKKLKYTLSPDADYPLINLEKGRFAPEFSRNVKSENISAILGGGTANIVPGKAYALIKNVTEEILTEAAEKAEKTTGARFTFSPEDGGFRVCCAGQSAHAANPEKGNNANSALITLLVSLPYENDEAVTALKELLEISGHNSADGEKAGVKMSDEASGALSFNFGILRYDGETLHGGFDLRCPLCANETNVKEVLRERLAAAGFGFTNDPGMRKVHYVPADAEIVREALAVYEDYTGRQGECLSTGGGTYVHGIEGGIAFGIEYPGTDYRIHGADEFAITDELLLTAAMYAQIIRDLCMKG